jgi:spore germination protein
VDGVRRDSPAAALALLVLLGGAVGAAQGRPAAAPASPTVLGFQSEPSSARLIDRSARALSVVGVDGVDLTGPGQVSAPDQWALRQLARAKANGLQGVFLVNNWSDRSNGFSERLAHETLANPSAVSSVAQSLASDVATEGWNGVSIDLEALQPRDAGGLDALVSHLHTDMPVGSSLTVCLSATTSLAGYRAMGYDLQTLAANATQLILMTYDDHGPWERTPGPIGPLRWQRASLATLEKVVPSSEIYLGAANYAYAWQPHHRYGLSVGQARQTARRWHARPRWIRSAGEWRARHGHSTLWWSDARSLRMRLRMAERLGVYGVAIWSLGSGDPIPQP